MKIRTLLISAIFAVVCLLTPVYSQAATFNEGADAGQTLLTAEVLVGGIDKIQGSLSGQYDADMYRFHWNGGNFYANTVDYSLPFSLQQDTELFLFGVDGKGILANNEAWTGLNIPAGSSYLYKTNLAAGDYFLGVTINNLEPVDDSLYYGVFGYISTLASPPQGPDPTSGPLAGWGNDDLYAWGNGNYVINLAEADLSTGAAGPSHPTGSTVVPEPFSLLLLGTGLMGLAGLRRFKK